MGKLALGPIKGVILATSGLAMMSGTLIAPGLPGLAVHFNLPEDSLAVRMVLTMPGLMLAVTGFFSGMLSDLMGRKRLHRWGLFLYAAAGGAGMLSNSLEQLLAARALQGAATGALMATSSAMVGDYFHGPDRPKFLGMQSSVIAGSGVIFLSLGGWLADVSWRAPFAIYLIAVLLWPLAHWALPKDQPHARAKTGEEQDGFPWPALAPFATGFLLMAILYAVPVNMPFLMIHHLGLSAAHAGQALAMGPLTAAISGLFYSRIQGARHPTAHFWASFTLSAVGLWQISQATSFWPLLAGLVVNGLGIGMVFPALSVWALGLTGEHHRGRVMGGLSSAIFMGQFASPLLTLPLAKGPQGIQTLFQTLALSCIGLAIAFLAYNSLRAKGPATEPQ